MIFKTLTLGVMDNNCYIIADKATKDAVVIDAPCEASKILELLNKENLNCRYIILTHSHFDHIGAVEELRKATGAKLAIHTLEADELLHPSMPAYAPRLEKAADILLNDGDTITVGSITIKAIHTPGHTKGGLCYYVDGKLFSGDTLFFGDVGRCDLSGGDYNTLKKSIKERLYTLPDDTTVYPGHGRSTTIAYEKANNNYVRTDWEYEY